MPGTATLTEDIRKIVMNPFGFILVVSLTQTSNYMVCGLASRKGYFLDDVDPVQVGSPKTVLLKTVHVPSELACAQKCFGNDLCSYKSFDSLFGNCQLYKDISSDDVIMQKKVSQKVIAKDPCDTKDCSSRCKCKSLLGTDEYACDCGTEGLSKTSTHQVHRSCSAALATNGNVSGTYLIQPSLKFAPVSLKCERGIDGKGYAVFHHDTETEIYVSGYDDACDGYKKQFAYNESMEWIILAINNSISCQQRTKAVCRGVTFLSRGCSVLIGRNSKKLSYWGGGPHDGVGCSCGITGSCADPATKCNCNINNNYDNIWYMDEGYVAWKDDLPMTGIEISDTGLVGNEAVKYTIGPLRCEM